VPSDASEIGSSEADKICLDFSKHHGFSHAKTT
jgi:hypothetical protein